MMGMEGELLGKSCRPALGWRIIANARTRFAVQALSADNVRIPCADGKQECD
jgi:hypothetical protein